MTRGSAAATLVASSLALLGSPWGCGLEFACQDDQQCTLQGRAGVCEVDGFCSFPDSSCPSGRRYHRSAADALAEQCTTPQAEGSSGAPPEPEVPDLPDLPPVPGCGDGIVDEGEECDDGNAVDGDGCNTDCVPSGQVIWNAEYDGLDDGDDDAWGIALSPSGDVFVAGRVGLDGEGSTAAWVRKYDRAGNELWTRDIIHGDAGQDGALALAQRSDGALFVAGWAATTVDPAAPSNDQDFWLATLDPDQGTVESETIFDGSGGNDRIRGLAVAADGDLVGAGWVGASPDRPDDGIWYGRFDAQTLDLVWSDVLTSEPGRDDRAYQAASLASGGLVVVGSASARGWWRRLDAQGSSLETVTSDDTTLWVDVETIPGSTDLILGGTNFSGPGRAVAQRISAEGETVWAGGWSEIEPTTQEDIYAMAVGPGGELVIAGRVKLVEDDEGWDAWLTKFDAEGQVLWTRLQRGSAGSNDVASNVAIDHDGAVVLVGYRVSASNGRNIWVRKYTP